VEPETASTHLKNEQNLISGARILKDDMASSQGPYRFSTLMLV
jgi:hypothetical protein